MRLSIRSVLIRGFALIATVSVLANCAAKDQAQSNTNSSVTAKNLGGPSIPPGQTPNSTLDLTGRGTLVPLLYKVLLGRTVEDAAWPVWSKMGCLDIASVVATSPEFQNRLANQSDAVYVETLYNGLLNRASDAAGKAEFVRALGWYQASATPVLAAAQARLAIVPNFITSPEMANVCASYGTF